MDELAGKLDMERLNQPFKSLASVFKDSSTRGPTSVDSKVLKSGTPVSKDLTRQSVGPKNAEPTGLEDGSTGIVHTV